MQIGLHHVLHSLIRRIMAHREVACRSDYIVYCAVKPHLRHGYHSIELSRG